MNYINSILNNTWSERSGKINRRKTIPYEVLHTIISHVFDEDNQDLRLAIKSIYDALAKIKVSISILEEKTLPAKDLLPKIDPKIDQSDYFYFILV